MSFIDKHFTVRPSLLMAALLVGIGANATMNELLSAQVAGGNPTTTLTLRSPIIIDDDNDTKSNRFETTGMPRYTPLEAGYQGDVTYFVNQANTNIAKWRFDNLINGSYRIWITWPRFTFNTTTAQYEVKNAAGTSVTKFTEDQTLVPSTGMYERRAWKLSKDTVQVTDGSLHITLAGGPRYTMGDAIALELIPAQSSSSTAAYDSSSRPSDCTIPPSTPGRPHQNPANSLDASRDGHVTPIDTLIVSTTLNAGGSRQLPPVTSPPATYVDTSGDNFLTPTDLLQLINFFNRCPNGFINSSSSSSSQAADVTTLRSVTISCNQVTVAYEKNYDACAGLKNSSNVLQHGSNMFCQRGGTVTVPLGQFVAGFTVGSQVKLCHGNNGTCSDTVAVTGTTACSTSSSSQTSSSVSSAAPVGTYCGDGLPNTGEQCDDGNKKPGDGCSPTCSNEFCGDRVATPRLNEECDDGNTAVNDGCNTQCRHEFCGDTIVQTGIGEQCDDGNMRRGDGCSERCQTEGNSSSSVSSSSSAASESFVACPQGLLCSKAVFSNQCTNMVIDCAPGYRLEMTNTACGTSVCTGQCGRCVTAGSSVSSVAPPAQAKLEIAQKVIGLTDTAVKNQKNINLLRWEARSENADVLLTKSIYKASAGSLLNGQNYALWVDTDNNAVVDTILQKGVPVQNGTVTFDQLSGGGYVVPKDASVIFEVHTDVVSSLSSTELKLAFSTDSADYIAAERLSDGARLAGIRTNGACAASCQIGIGTVDSKLWNLISQGDLFVYKSVPQRYRQLLGGTLSDHLMNLAFRAENEPVEVTDLQLMSLGSRALSVDRLELYKQGETTSFATATIGGCGTDQIPTTHQGISIRTFCANMESGQLVVPSGQVVTVIVRARMKSDENGGISNEYIQFMVSGEPVSDNATGRGAVRARGWISSNNISANDEDTIAEGEIFIGLVSPASRNLAIMTELSQTVLSKIASITDANMDSNVLMPAIPTGFAPVGQFKFEALTNINTLNGLNKAVIDGLIFTVAATNVQLRAESFRLYNVADNTTKQTCIAKNADGTVLTGLITGTVYVECSGLSQSQIDVTLDSGSNKKLALQVEITNNQISSTSNASLQVSLQNFSNIGANTLSPAGSHFKWLDRDAVSSASYLWLEYAETVVRSTLYRN